MNSFEFDSMNNNPFHDHTSFAKGLNLKWICCRCPNTAKLQVLGYAPTVGLEEFLRQTLEC